MGDSITVGAGPGTQGGGYRYYLKQRLGDAIDFVGSSVEYPGPLTDREHDGHGGWTTRDLIDGRSGLGCAAEWVAACSPDVVLLMIGRNDPWPWTDTLVQYRELAAAIFGSAPQATLVWSNVLLPADQGQGETVHCEVQDAALRQVVTELRASGRRVYYVDNYRRLRGRFDIFSDQVHLNDFGYRLLADGWVKPVTLGHVP